MKTIRFKSNTIAKLPPLHLACSNDELRDNLMCVHIKNGIATATNATILVRQQLHEWFDMEQLAFLEDKHIPSEVWKIMAAQKFPIFTVNAEGISVRVNRYYTMNFLFASTQGLKYPDIGAVLNAALDGSILEPAKEFCLNIDLLHTLSKILGQSYHGLRMIFNKPTRPCVIYNDANDSAIAIIMPIVSGGTLENNFKRFIA